MPAAVPAGVCALAAADHVRRTKLFFTPYEPSLQPYLSHAVDALAKLLARDVPNRTYYKVLLAADPSAATPPGPYELLTRTFALAICVVPEQFRDSRPNVLIPLIEARKPLLMQGLLAADILASLAPNYESGARARMARGGQRAGAEPLPRHPDAVRHV